MADVFTKDNLPPLAAFRKYRKKTLTLAFRVEGPFECVTVDGNHVRCEDGYLGLDSQGYPYPIQWTDFHTVYEEER